MKRIFAVLFVMVILVIGVSFYQGWISLSSDRGDAGTKEVNVNLKVDRDKFDKDTQALKDKSDELTGKAVAPESTTNPAESPDR